MQEYFYSLAEDVNRRLRAGEVATCSFEGEDSEFVRFNQAQVRQAGTVVQRSITLQLIGNQRMAKATTTLSGVPVLDRERLGDMLHDLRDMLAELPDDPHLCFAEEVRSSERTGRNDLPPAAEVVGSVLTEARGTDMVGIYGAGGMYRGFANSLGQRNWHSTYSYHLDWSLYHREDKAVKTSDAGFEWNLATYQHKMEEARGQLSWLARPARTVDPGRYRIYLSPVALASILSTIADGFGLRGHRTRRTCLLKMLESNSRLHPDVHIAEHTAQGLAPDFQDDGFVKPGRVPLIQQGCFQRCLTSPRSSREYGIPTNGANEDEVPESLDMAAGTLPQDRVLQELGTGVYVNNLWYLNYSDPTACRLTGMTRFATFWVEHGQIVAPLNVMRFDETLYRMLGDNLLGLTTERDFIPSPYTYGSRDTGSARLPGALVDDFTFTL